jgi:hypothetical protein
VDPDSDVCLRLVIRDVLDLAGIADRERIERDCQTRLEELDKEQSWLWINGRQCSRQELYLAYARGEFFSGDATARKTVEAVREVFGNSEILRFEFLSYSDDVLRLCDEVYALLQSTEENSEIRSQHDCSTHPNGPCIYCLRSDGGFCESEHVYPESLGNEEVILSPGIVCHNCNHGVLSKLDDALVHHDGVAFLRTVFLTQNPKTGAFPSAKGSNFVIRKTGPRELDIQLHSGAKPPIEERLPDGSVKLSIEVRGRHKFDPRSLARSLYKVALGFVAWKQGADAAREPRYNPARDFILGGMTFPNSLLVQRTVTPMPTVRTTYQVLSDGTVFQLEIFGLCFIINLEPEPKLTLPSELDGFDIFPLFGDAP